jgi:hypothetical protein
MPTITPEKFREMLATVAIQASGPKVVFPFGFKIASFNGEKVVVPLTPREYSQAVARETGKSPDVLVDDPGCHLSVTQCEQTGCGGKCKLQYSQSPGGDVEFWCLCTTDPI